MRDDIKVALKEMERESVDWIEVACHVGQSQVPVTTTVYSDMVENFLISWAAISV